VLFNSKDLQKSAVISQTYHNKNITCVSPVCYLENSFQMPQKVKRKVFSPQNDTDFKEQK